MTSKISRASGHLLANAHTNIERSSASKSWTPLRIISGLKLAKRSCPSLPSNPALAKDHNSILRQWALRSLTGLCKISSSVIENSLSHGTIPFWVNDHKNWASWSLLNSLTPLNKISSWNFSNSSLLSFPVLVKDHRTPASPRFSNFAILSCPSRILCSTIPKNLDLFKSSEAKPIRILHTAGVRNEVWSRRSISFSHSVTNHASCSLSFPNDHTIVARSRVLHVSRSFPILFNKVIKISISSFRTFLVEKKFFFGPLAATLAKWCRIVKRFIWVMAGESLNLSYK